MLAHLNKIKGEADNLEHKDERIGALERELERQVQVVIANAQIVSDARRDLANDLIVQIESELKHLHMERTRLGIRMERLQDPQGIEVDGAMIRLTKNGWDDVEFLISANPGEPLRSLSKIASGGELSRIMLALKTIFAQVDRIPVLIFDEVDTGVSGRAPKRSRRNCPRLHTAVKYLPLHIYLRSRAWRTTNIILRNKSKMSAHRRK